MDTPADYVRAGLALVPIPSRQKGPTTKGWNLRENVTTDVHEAVSLTGNIGLAHVYSTPLTMALDIDDLPKARVWLAGRDVDLDGLMVADDAVQIASGRQGRAKLLYRLPSGLAPIESLTIKETANVDGEEKQITVLEIRCATRDGLTLQDVLPPSIHPDTDQPYRWGGKGDWRNIPEIPETLLNVWQQALAARETGRTRRKGRLSLFESVDDTPRQRATLQAQLQHISADCSYEFYRDIVWAILSFGWPDAEELARQWCETAPDSFEEDDFNNVVSSHDPTRSPTIGTIYYHARRGGWHG